MEQFLEKHYKKIIILILSFMLVASVFNAWNDSAIFDETAHIPAGYSYLTRHDMRLNPEHPPLIKDLSALPLLFFHPTLDISRDFWTKNANDAQWEAGKVFLWESGNDADKIIFWSRIPIVLLSLLLGFFIFKWTRELSGITAGLFALSLYAFDPNVLGHNHFVTTDLGIAAFITFAFYYFIKFLKDPTWKNVFVASFFLGLVQLAKFSAVLAFPVIGLALIVYPLAKYRMRNEKYPSEQAKKFLEYLGKGAIIFALSLVLVWVVYYFNTFNMPQEELPKIINYYFNSDDTNFKTVYARKLLFWMNDYPLLQPMADYFFGIGRVFQRIAGGNQIYFMGELRTHGFLSYFPLVFLMKEPLPTLFFMLLASTLALYKMLRSTPKIRQFLVSNIASFSLMSFILLYAYSSITSGLNIGFRHLFPILPLAFILSAKSIFEFLHYAEKPTKIVLSTLTIILTVLLVSETITTYPSYMSYFNQSVGGPKNGYLYVTDSNADWGQDLKRLDSFIQNYNRCAKCYLPPKNQGEISMDYLDCQGFNRTRCLNSFDPAIKKANSYIDDIRVDYFGGGNPPYYLGDKYISWWREKRPIEEGWYAISATLLEESLHEQNKKDSESYRWLKNIKPVSQVGTSIFIYHITKDDLLKIAK